MQSEEYVAHLPLQLGPNHHNSIVEADFRLQWPKWDQRDQAEADVPFYFEDASTFSTAICW